jgi:hypothetical protein
MVGEERMNNMNNIKDFTHEEWELLDVAIRKCHSNVATSRCVEGEVTLFDVNENEIIMDESAVQAEFTALQIIASYQNPRKAEYDLLNQFEMQFDDQLNGTTTWVDAINEIKARYPK